MQSVEMLMDAIIEMRISKSCISVKLLVVATLLFCIADVMAAQDPLTRSIDTTVNNNQQEAVVQKQIDQLDDETRAMLEEYQRLSRELEVTVIYNDQLDRIVSSQQQEIDSIQQQMKALELTQREIVPLTLRMVHWLEELVAADIPFLPDERRLRIKQLKALMDRADISMGEKYRRLLEAYQIEMAYGRTIESYRDEVNLEGGRRSVDLLRFGRMGLFYQTLDRQETGHWHAADAQWQVLPDAFLTAVRRGSQIARKQAAPDLVRLPVAAAQGVLP
ncbi:MAG: DUF3450 domain-containing protein [Sedimenticola sp.]|nr:DUF3450 domain-containing protein [Sedimenticola sp.]